MLRVLAAFMAAFFVFVHPAVSDDVAVPLSQVPHFSLKQCGSPCVIRYSPGGFEDEFVAAARQAKRTGRIIQIDGPCISACTIMADQARSNVCITPRAWFGIHQAYLWVGSKLVGREPVRYSPALSAVIKRKGGQPRNGLLNLTYRDLKHLFRTC